MSSQPTQSSITERLKCCTSGAAEELQPVIVCNIKIIPRFLSSEQIHTPRNADVLLATDDVKLHKASF